MKLETKHFNDPTIKGPNGEIYWNNEYFCFRDNIYVFKRY